MPLSRRCAVVIGVGAPVNGSPPLAVFGKAITSRIDSLPVNRAHTRSKPKAIPP